MSLLLKEKLKREFLYDLYENYVPHRYFGVGSYNYIPTLEDMLAMKIENYINLYRK